MLELPVVTYAEMGDGEELIAEVLRRARAGQSDRQIATELTAAGYHAPLKQRLSVESVRRIRMQHGVLSAEGGVPASRAPGMDQPRPGRHAAGRAPRLGLLPDPSGEAPDSNAIRRSACTWSRTTSRVLKQLKELLRGKRFSLTIEPRSS